MKVNNYHFFDGNTRIINKGESMGKVLYKRNKVRESVRPDDDDNMMESFIRMA